jgi:deazaflavin-dependent oxidoreductase (nitroreductase family)
MVIRWPISADETRRMYAGGRGNATARRWARFWSLIFGLGLFPQRWVSLEVPGRRTGRIRRFPLGMAEWHDDWFLVSMLGDNCQWVRNVRAAEGYVVVRRRRRIPCLLREVPVGERAPILRRYVQIAPGARPHLPLSASTELPAVTAVADRFPVFRVLWDVSPKECDQT